MNATLARMKSDKANDNVLNEVIKIVEELLNDYWI